MLLERGHRAQHLDAEVAVGPARPVAELGEPALHGRDVVARRTDLQEVGPGRGGSCGAGSFFLRQRSTIAPERRGVDLSGVLRDAGLLLDRGHRRDRRRPVVAVDLALVLAELGEHRLDAAHDRRRLPPGRGAQRDRGRLVERAGGGEAVRALELLQRPHDAGDVPVVDLADVVAEAVELVLQEVRDRDDGFGHVAEQLGTRPVRAHRPRRRWSWSRRAASHRRCRTRRARRIATTSTSGILMRTAVDTRSSWVTGTGEERGR